MKFMAEQDVSDIKTGFLSSLAVIVRQHAYVDGIYLNNHGRRRGQVLLAMHLPKYAASWNASSVCVGLN